MPYIGGGIEWELSRSKFKGKCHSSLYEGDNRNANFTFFSVCKYLVWGIISLGYSLQNVVPSPKALHTGHRIYEVFKPTHLGKLKGCERSFRRKKIKNRRPSRKKLKEEETYKNKYVY